ncbi:MAG: DNA-binding protein [Deltaproteobacteria bacterium]|nr:MAG: DNA-binding protein [Deltaproteobacteria bacterium]
MKPLKDIKFAAEFLGLPVPSVRGKVSRREIPFIKIGRRVLFDLEDLQAFVEKLKVQPRPRREVAE